MRIPKTLVAVIPALALAAATTAPALAATAAPKPVRYANCTALNKVYPHGVARKGARDKVTGATRPVTTFTVNDAVYKLNAGSDRDKDGIACEKK